MTALSAPADAAERRERLGLPDGYVLSVATLEPRKGLDVLVRAMALPAVGPLIWWWSARPGGVGSTWQWLPRRVCPPTGGTSPADWTMRNLAAVLAGAAVLAAPSRSEGFGLPVLEAMAAGVPVVCSDAPALVELAGGVGVVVRREDPVALASALGDLLTDGRPRPRSPSVAADGLGTSAGLGLRIWCGPCMRVTTTPSRPRGDARVRCGPPAPGSRRRWVCHDDGHRRVGRSLTRAPVVRHRVSQVQGTASGTRFQAQGFQAQVPGT